MIGSAAFMLTTLRLRHYDSANAATGEVSEVPEVLEVLDE